MGKYDYCCDDMFLREDHPRRPGRAGTWIFGQEFTGQEYLEQAPNMVEVLVLTDDYMMMNGFPEGYQRRTYNMGDHKGGPFPKTNRGCNKVMIFCGTDPEDMRNLGAQIEFHLGQGEEESVFVFDQPKAILVPKDVRYGPIYIKYDDNAPVKRPVFCINVYDVNSKAAAQIEDDWDYVGDQEKINWIIGGNSELYRSFYGSDPTNPFGDAKMKK